jgi:hypothetical protein
VTDSARLASRIGLAVLALAVGAMVGVVTTFAHRQLPPWGLIAGLMIITALLVGARLAFGGRLVAGAAAVGVVGAILVLVLAPTDGIVPVADDVLGTAWAVGAALIAVVAVVWPGIGPRPEAASESE